MKVRFGDLKFKNGRTMEEAARFCTNVGDCEGCTCQTKNECCLLPDFRELEKRFDEIMNYEIEVPEVPVAAVSDDRPQKDDDMDDTERSGYKKVYICSPYRGNVYTNTENAKDFCKWAVSEKCVMPIAPHIYFTQFLDDDNEDQRVFGMDMGIQWLNECSEIWVLGETLSDGMTREIAEAGRLGLPIRFFAETDNGFDERMAEIKKGKQKINIRRGGEKAIEGAKRIGLAEGEFLL